MQVETPQSASNKVVFRAFDPEQSVLRACLDTLTEEELIAVESDLGYHARTGLLTSRIRKILDAFDAGALGRAA